MRGTFVRTLIQCRGGLARAPTRRSVAHGASQVPIILTFDKTINQYQIWKVLFYGRTVLAEVLADADDGRRTTDGFHSLHRRRRKNHGGDI